MLLKQHILNDLERYRCEPKHVVSEELMSLMVHMFENEKCLVNPSIVSINKLDQIIRKIYNDKIPHSQLLIEFNSRSLTVAKKPENDDLLVHYAAMDVFCNERGEIIVFIADHYFGKEYRSIKSKFDFPVYFIIAGGSSYQNDSNHCPFFAMQHLVLSAKDINLHAKLKHSVEQFKLSYPFVMIKEAIEQESNTIYFQIKKNKQVYFFYGQNQKKLKLKLSKEEQENVTLDVLESYRSKIIDEMQKEQLLESINVPWFDLDPEYNACTQSLSQLMNYKTYVSEKNDEKISNKKISDIDNLTGPNLIPDSLSGKIQNKSITAFACECINEIKHYLDSDTYNETKLIDICYTKRYCNIVELLNHEKEIRDTFENRFAGSSTENSLIDLIFSNQFVLNCFMENATLNNLNNNGKLVKSIPSFKEILANSNLIVLIQTGFVGLDHLFSKISCRQNNKRSFMFNELQCISKNQWLLKWAVENLNFLSQLNSNELIELLASTISPDLLKNPAIKDLYFDGQLTIVQLLAVKEPVLKQLSELEGKLINSNKLKTQIMALITGYPAASPTSVDSIEEHDIKTSSFRMPGVSRITLFSAESCKKPSSQNSAEMKSSP